MTHSFKLSGDMHDTCLPLNLDASLLQKKLLTWFDQSGRHHLPWQIDKTPYRVWISEIMLQQTQVATVIPYYERFMQSFPTLSSLASADEDQVLHVWAGLGYYSRARHLQHTAKMIMHEYGGQFPNKFEMLQQLPGIGPSTAGAILAIAFNQHAVILDGNVKRVLARFFAITDPIDEKIIENKLWDLATILTPKKRVADYTQAIMDLGAMICVRGTPQCSICPLTQDCAARQQGIAHTLPNKKLKKTIPTRSATFLLLEKNGELLLQKRPAHGIWGGLWSLPEMPHLPDLSTVQAFCQQQFKMAITAFKTLSVLRHTFSHYHLEMHPIVISVSKLPCKVMAESKQIWYNPSNPAAIGLPNPIKTIVRNYYEQASTMREAKKRSRRISTTPFTG